MRALIGAPAGAGAALRPASRRFRGRDLCELIRAPAAISVPGDVLVGAAAGDWPLRRRTAGMIASSVCLYWAGMALNDYADRELDADERPERPVPSGRITPGGALAVSCGLAGAGLMLAGLAGRRAGLGRVGALAVTAAAYDLALKSTPAGPAAMALARVLNVGMAVSRPRAAGRAAALIGAHTYTVTTLSRYEVRPAGRWLPMTTLACSTAVGVAAALPRDGLRGDGPSGAHRAMAVTASAAYLASYCRAQLTAIGTPTAGNFRSAVAAGILGLLPLQASLAAGSGSLCTATSLVIGHMLARGLARKAPVT